MKTNFDQKVMHIINEENSTVVVIEGMNGMFIEKDTEWKLYNNSDEGFYIVSLTNDGKKFGYANERRKEKYSSIEKLSQTYDFIQNDVKLLQKVKKFVEKIS